MKERRISTFNEYENLFLNESIYTSREDKKNIILALEIAIDTRKFEIELYWKRATYFWAFIASTFAAYFLLLNADNIDNYRGFTIAVSVIGLFFSLGWYFVNRGSKMWQSNWEQHVCFLENSIGRPLFDTVKVPNYDFWKLSKSFPFSVSKVNQNLSLLMIVFWFLTFIYSVLYSFPELGTERIKVFINDHQIFLFVLIVIAVVFMMAWFYKKSLCYLMNDNFRNSEYEDEIEKVEDEIKSKPLFFVKNNY